MKLQLTALCAGLVVAAGTASYAPQATATEAASGTAYCQSSLPTADVNIRKSPLTIRNLGSSNSFVSCAIPWNQSGNPQVDVVVFFVNKTGADIDVDCTMTDGLDPTFATNLSLPPAVFYPLTTTVKVTPSLPEDTAAVWSAADLGVTLTGLNGVTCLLPPGVDIVAVGADA